MPKLFVPTRLTELMRLSKLLKHQLVVMLCKQGYGGGAGGQRFWFQVETEDFFVYAGETTLAERGVWFAKLE